MFLAIVAFFYLRTGRCSTLKQQKKTHIESFSYWGIFLPYISLALASVPLNPTVQADSVGQ